MPKAGTTKTAAKKSTAKKSAAKKAAAKGAPAKKRATSKAAAKKPAAYQPTGAPGRPPGSSCITDDQCRQVLERVACGETIMAACFNLKLVYTTVYYRLHRDFEQETMDAERMGAEALVQAAHDDLDPPCGGAKMFPHQVTLRIARSKNRLWRAERMAPDRFGQRSKVEHSTPPGRPLEVNANMDPNEAYLKYIRGEK